MATVTTEYSHNIVFLQSCVVITQLYYTMGDVPLQDCYNGMLLQQSTFTMQYCHNSVLLESAALTKRFCHIVVPSTPSLGTGVFVASDKITTKIQNEKEKYVCKT